MTARGAFAAFAAVSSILLGAVSCGVLPSKTVAGQPPTTRTTEAPVPKLPTMDGDFEVIAGPAGTPPVTWVFTPCGDGCAQVDMSGPGAAQRATARYIKLNWTIDAHSNAAVQCGDGTFVPGTAHYAWNPDTLQGRYWSTRDSRPCGNDESLDTYPVPLTLTQVAPKAAHPIAERDTLKGKLLRQRPFEGDECSAGGLCTQVWRGV